MNILLKLSKEFEDLRDVSQVEFLKLQTSYNIRLGGTERGVLLRVGSCCLNKRRESQILKCFLLREEQDCRKIWA